MEIQEANKLWGISFEPLEERTGPQLGIPHVPHGDFSRWQTVHLDNDTAYGSIVDQVLREALGFSPANNNTTIADKSVSSIRTD
jgi:hypothetical protein